MEEDSLKVLTDVIKDYKHKFVNEYKAHKEERKERRLAEIRLKRAEKEIEELKKKIESLESKLTKKTYTTKQGVEFLLGEEIEEESPNDRAVY